MLLTTQCSVLNTAYTPSSTSTLRLAAKMETGIQTIRPRIQHFGTIKTTKTEQYGSGNSSQRDTRAIRGLRVTIRSTSRVTRSISGCLHFTTVLSMQFARSILIISCGWTATHSRWSGRVSRMFYQTRSMHCMITPYMTLMLWFE